MVQQRNPTPITGSSPYTDIALATKSTVTAFNDSVSWDTVLIDEADGFDVNNEQYTVPATGYYHIIISVGISQMDTDGNVTIRWRSPAEGVSLERFQYQTGGVSSAINDHVVLSGVAELPAAQWEADLAETPFGVNGQTTADPAENRIFIGRLRD